MIRDIGLGSLLRALLNEVDGGLQRIYDGLGVAFRPRYYPIVQALRGHAPIGVGALAARLGMTQPAVSQTLREMGRAGLIVWSDSKDRRLHLVGLSAEGMALCDRLDPLWAAVAASVARIELDAGIELAGTLERALAALAEMPFEQRIQESLREQEDMT